MHTILRLAGPALLLGLSSCTQFLVTTQAGYTQMSLSGDVGLTSSSGGSTVVVEQDVKSALGIGDDQGSPYGRVQLDLGVPVLTLSGFGYDESARGTLNATFGNITAGRDVLSDFSITNLKASLGFEFGVGPVSVSPGLAVDWFDIDLRVEDITGFAAEELEVRAPVPLLFLRGDVDLGIVSGLLEVGYLTVPEISDFEGTFWDIEALVEVRPTSMFHLFAGYRLMTLDAEGESDGDAFGVDLEVKGWVVGGGLRF